MTLMLSAAGAEAVGIDDYIGYRWGLGFRPGRYLQYSREVGLLKAARKVVGEFVYDRHYFATLSDATGLRLTDHALDLRPMRAEALEFEDESMDVIHSNATWEHLMHVEDANRQLARVLKPGGVAYIEIHLFPSISGGHDLPWIVPGKLELGDIQPWRHLRDASWQAPVPLNRFRASDYKRMFEATPGLRVVDWQAEVHRRA